MLVTVTTVKDSVDNVASFVRRNQRAGADHLVLFLDEPDDEVEGMLSELDHVTYVVTDRSWWRGARPRGLNRRQKTNANIVRCLLADQDWSGWLFHIDADEVLHLDRDRLEDLPRDIGVVDLETLEVASQPEAGDAWWFKRQLDDDELALLRLLGVLSTAENAEYFHGHISGKSGLRPTLDLHMHIHKPRTPEGGRAPGFSADWLRVLHLESHDFEEFKRKWGNMLTSGVRPRTRQTRPDVRAGLAAIDQLGLDPETRERYLRRIYDLNVRDDVDTLRELRLLVEIDLEASAYVPRPLPAGAATLLRDRLELVRLGDKQVYREGLSHQVEAALVEQGVWATAGANRS